MRHVSRAKHHSAADRTQASGFVEGLYGMFGAVNVLGAKGALQGEYHG